MKQQEYMLVLTSRMVRDTLCIKGPMGRRELCELMSVDPNIMENQVDVALNTLIQTEEITTDYNNGTFKARLVLS